MKDMKQIRPVQVIWAMILGCAFAIFSLQQLVKYSLPNMVLTGAVSFFIGAGIGRRYYNDHIQFVLRRKITSLFTLFAALCVMIAQYKVKAPLASNAIISVLSQMIASEAVCSALNVCSLPFYALSLPALWVLLTWIYKAGCEMVCDILEGISGREKILYAVVTAVLLAVVTAVYFRENQWFFQHDNVYSMDSGWCFDNVYRDNTYYDIRHPMMSQLTFPIWAVIACVLEVAVSAAVGETLTAVFLQWTNVAMLVLIGIMLRKMTGRLAAFFLYICSFTTLLFALTLEKYQICAFLLVLYVYFKLQGKPRTNGLFILTAGTLPTNAAIGVMELFDECSVADKMRHLGKLVISGVLVLVCFGRVHMLNVPQLLGEITGTHDYFTLVQLSVWQKVMAVLNMMESCFVALPSQLQVVLGEDRYMWVPVTEQIGAVSVIVAAVMGIGAVTGIRNRFCRVCTYWTGFAFVLFVGLNWVPYESPLFAIIFSWAVIGLFVKGLDVVLEKVKLNAGIAYGGILLWMLYINIMRLVDIGKFLSR